MARHLNTHVDPALVWVDNNLEQPEAADYLAERKRDIAERRERRHAPPPVELDEYDDDLDIDDWTGPIDLPETAPAPLPATAHANRNAPTLPVPLPRTGPSGMWT